MYPEWGLRKPLGQRRSGQNEGRYIHYSVPPMRNFIISSHQAIVDIVLVLLSMASIVYSFKPYQNLPMMEKGSMDKRGAVYGEKEGEFPCIASGRIERLSLIRDGT